MNFLLDQDVYRITANYLIDAGHDVLLAADLGMSRAADIDLLRKAHELGRIFVTRDSDFGRLVFADGEYAGIIFLRMSPTNQPHIHAVLSTVLQNHLANELLRAFVTIDNNGYRLRSVH
jgi:predicted nuclease of predicted toxin-antitoxin system